MRLRPSIGAKYRSILTGRYARVMNVLATHIVVVIEGNRERVHVKDFLAEYRFVKTPTRRHP